VDLTALLAELTEREIVSVLLEGGPTLAGAFLAEGLVDRVVAYLAPTLLGGGAAALGDAGVATLAQAYHLDIEDITTIGPDLRIIAAVRDRANLGEADGERPLRAGREDADLAAFIGARPAPSRREN
jgi:diaminohydroxyphosphoribosylaminopyrimidine deaminase/5-amino-6-(5-phosphoribosylamino)uracil reductase